MLARPLCTIEAYLSHVPLLQRPSRSLLGLKTNVHFELVLVGGSYALTYLTPFLGILDSLGSFYIDLLGHNYKYSIKQHLMYCNQIYPAFST